MKNTKILYTLIAFFLISLLAGPGAFGSAQETVETAPDTTITEETTTSTPDATETASEETRNLSAEDLEEISAAHRNLTEANEAFTLAQQNLITVNAVFEYVLGRIVKAYGINLRTEAVNIATGAITDRTPEVVSTAWSSAAENITPY